MLRFRLRQNRIIGHRNNKKGGNQLGTIHQVDEMNWVQPRLLPGLFRGFVVLKEYFVPFIVQWMSFAAGFTLKITTPWRRFSENCGKKALPKL